MLFNTFAFFIFLPIVLIIYWGCCRHKLTQNLVLLLASIFFYCFWNWKFIVLILLSSIISYLTGICIEKSSINGRKKLFNGVNVVVNLLILGVFKYYNFFAENLSDLFLLLGLNIDVVTLKLILPLGISFYSFQAISYTVDVYKKRTRAIQNIVDYFFVYFLFSKANCRSDRKSVIFYTTDTANEDF